MSCKNLLLMIGVALTAGLPGRVAAEPKGTTTPDDAAQERYVACSGTVTFRFANDLRKMLGFSFVPHGHLDEGSDAAPATFPIDGASSLELKTERGLYSGIAGGILRTRGAFLLDKPGVRVVIGDPAIEADQNGVLIVRSMMDEENATSRAVFELVSVMLDLRAAAGELHLIGELAITRPWARTLGFPEAAGVIVGTIVVEAGLEPVAAAEVSATRCQVEGTSRDAGQSLGPGAADVVVANLQLVIRYPTDDPDPGISAYAVGTTACNLGTAHANWIEDSPFHPVIVQNAYRLKDDRFEQIGLSWLKHGFHALSEFFCSQECDPMATTGAQLGVLCSDPYSAGLNGIQINLSPRSTVNANTGVFPWPWPGWVEDPVPEAYIDRRLQIHNADLDPLFNAGARYFVQGHYVLQDDAIARTHNNNASYREVELEVPEPGEYDLTINPSWSTQIGQPAVRAWQDVDPLSVVETDMQIPGEGLFILAAKASESPPGVWRYSYALQNLNSDQSASSFSVRLPPGAIVANIGFHDVDYHSGDAQTPTDWQPVVADGSITWSMVPCDPPETANALRFGTVYSFYFESTTEPAPTTITVGLFKPGVYSEITGTSVGPLLPLVDCDGDGLSNACELDCGAPGGLCDVPGCGEIQDCNANEMPDNCEPDCNDNDVPDDCDVDPEDPDGNGEVSDDCQPNGVPDECDFDCNGDGFPDDCEPVSDTDNDGVDDCDDLCLTVPTTVKCACPQYMDCCFPGWCYSDMNLPPVTAEDCYAALGTPTCVPDPCHDGCRIGDYDKNGTLDMFDHAAYQRCIGADASNEACTFAFDGNGNYRVDLEDYTAKIYEYLTGP